jgi:MoaA/NifB/PqqE/SkfB family radical SAM enzyme
MSAQTLEAAIQLAKHCKCTRITLGGGEPTLYPEIHKVLLKVYTAVPNASIGVISNGTGDFDALRLLCATIKHIPMADIAFSNDKYHRPIPTHVREWIQSQDSSSLIIREPKVGPPQAIGRGETLPPDEVTFAPPCVGSGISITPDGTLYPCLCGLTWDPRVPRVANINVNDVVKDHYAMQSLYYHEGRCCRDVASYEYWTSHTYPQYVAELRDPEELQTRHTACYCP